MRLCRRGKQIGHGALVDHHRGRNDTAAGRLDLAVEALREVPVHDPAVDQAHGRVVKLIDGDGVEMPEEAGRDWVASTPWGAHCGNQQRVHQVDLGWVRVRKIIM